MKIITLTFTLLFSLTAHSQVTAGKTMVAKGKVNALSVSKADDSRKLKRRSPVFDTDKVVTGNKSKAQLRMTDGGMIALKENTELMIADYQYSQESGQGSVTMELLKGGLRSVTGAIKAESGDYKLKTPLGSIGIRGTHYEVQLVGNEMFVAVWDGAIDIEVERGESEDLVSFGEGEDYSYGKISEDGEVTPLLEAPEIFEQGHASEQEEGTSDDSSVQEDETNDEDQAQTGSENNDDTEVDGQSQPATNNLEQNNQTPPEEEAEKDSLIAITDNEVDVEEDLYEEEIDPEDAAEFHEVDVPEVVDAEELDESYLATDEFDSFNATSAEEILSDRSGTLNYEAPEASNLASSLGEITDFSMDMEIDLDSGTVPLGEVTLTDDGGEWFFVFSGLISSATMDLDITFASHGDNLADGDITATFFNGIESIIGEFYLYEIENPEINTTGTFKIK